MIKKIELYPNTTKIEAIKLSKEVGEALVNEGYEIVEKSPDLIIGFGGDGTLLNLLFSRLYNLNSYYLGVNCGTLGFLQDFEIVENAHDFAKKIKTYTAKEIKLASLKVVDKKDSNTFYALNELYIVSDEEKSIRMEVMVNNDFLESYVGTGLIFSTPTGSTAHSLSAGGAVIYPGMDSLEMTPSEAIVNRKIRCFPRSICFSAENEIILRPSESQKIKIVADGIKVYTGDFDKLVVKIGEKVIYKINNPEKNFCDIFREKIM